MKKDFTRDYVTEAFRLYARLGCPTYEQIRYEIYNAELNKLSFVTPGESITLAEIATDKQTPLLLDILAVNKTLDILERGEKEHIVVAIKNVYFAYPCQPLRKGDISDRVRQYALCCPADERSVYRWLKEGRLLCAAIRGLRIAEIDQKKFDIYL